MTKTRDEYCVIYHSMEGPPSRATVTIHGGVHFGDGANAFSVFGAATSQTGRPDLIEQDWLGNPDRFDDAVRVLQQSLDEREDDAVREKLEHIVGQHATAMLKAKYM